MTVPKKLSDHQCEGRIASVGGPREIVDIHYSIYGSDPDTIAIKAVLVKRTAENITTRVVEDEDLFDCACVACRVDVDERRGETVEQDIATREEAAL